MSWRWDMGKASMADAERIANLAKSQGGPYMESLWALVEHGANDRVRAFAYGQATQCSTTPPCTRESRLS